MASYTPVTVTSYDASPPADNGSISEANRIAWATIKTKLGDPINTAVAAVDDAIAAAITTITSNLSTASSTLATRQASYATVSVNLYAPATTAAIFAQTSAPTGWTKGVTHNNKALRLVTGSVSTGGSTAFTSVFTSRSITTAEMPAHTHTWDSGTLTCVINDATIISSVGEGDHNSCATGSTNSPQEDVSTSEDDLSATSAIAATASGAPSVSVGSTMDFAVKYVDVIVATKD